MVVARLGLLLTTVFLLAELVPSFECRKFTGVAARSERTTRRNLPRLDDRLVVDRLVPTTQKGYTMAKHAHNSTLGISYFNSAHPNVSGGAYAGDTDCSTSLPVLCHRYDATIPRPCYVPAPSGGVMADAFYRGWGGDAALTTPVPGYLLSSFAVGDLFCQSHFGSDWKIAQHHTGRWVGGMDDSHYCNSHSSIVPQWPSSTATGGWGFWGFFDPSVAVDKNKRFWVLIRDQPANCWN